MSNGIMKVPFTWVCCPVCQQEGRVDDQENNSWAISTVKNRLLLADIKRIRCGNPECDYSEEFKV